MKLTVAFCAAISAFSAGAWTVMSGLQQTRTHSWQNFDLTADGIDHYAGSDIPLECAPGPLMADVAASATNPWTDSVIEWGSGPTLFGYRGEIRLEAGKTYVFARHLAGNVGFRLKIGDATLMESASGGYSYAEHSVAQTGWYAIDIKIAAGENDARGPADGAFGGAGFGFAWRDDGIVDEDAAGWAALRDDGSGTVLRHVESAGDSTPISVVGYERKDGYYDIYLRFSDSRFSGDVWIDISSPAQTIPVGEMPFAGQPRTTDIGVGGAAVGVQVAYSGDDPAPYLTVYSSNTSGKYPHKTCTKAILLAGDGDLEGPPFEARYNIDRPVVLNGRLNIPIFCLDYRVEKFDDELESWQAVAGFTSSADYLFRVGPDQSLRGVSRWRIAYPYGSASAVCGWTYFEVDAGLPLAGVATDPGDYGAIYDAVNAFDGDTRTFYHSLYGVGYTEICLDLGEEKMIGSVKYMPIYEYPRRFGHGCFQIANEADYSDAETFYEIPEAEFDKTLYLYEVSLARPAKGRYVRYVADGATEYINLAELEFGESDAAVEPAIEDSTPWQTPFAINGRLTVPVYGSAGDFVLQRLGSDGTTWTSVEIADSGHNLVYTVDNSLVGVSRWRIGYRYYTGSLPELWHEFSVDARCPASATAYSGCVVWTGNPIYSAASVTDGIVATIFHPAEQYFGQSDQWVALDFAASRTLTAFSYCPTADNYYYVTGERTVGCVVQYSASRDFADVTTVYTLAAPADTGSLFYTVEFENPISAQYVRMKPELDGMWFNLAEFEFTGSSDSPELSVAGADGDGTPRVSFSALYAGAYGVCLYRSTNPDAGFGLVATLDAGTVSWLDTGNVKIGVPYYYRAAKRGSDGSPGPLSADCASYTRYRWLERNEQGTGLREGVSLYCPGLDENYWYWTTWGYPAEKAFDGDPGNPDIWMGSYGNYNNPGIGVDFGEGARIHVAKVRFLASSGIYDRSGGLAAYGANEESGVWPYAGTRISQFTTPVDIQPGQWVDVDCDPAGAWRYFFMMRPAVDSAWYSYAAEIQFWGWDEADVADDGRGFFIVVR
ncbi:MAG: discoidin domain-containing protein [Kiritimatiellae bacterium]|nr:discoidin domain-containing protein [Kiritimatiellia bacterium]